MTYDVDFARAVRVNLTEITERFKSLRPGEEQVFRICTGQPQDEAYTIKIARV